MTATKQKKAPEHPLPPMTPVKSSAIKAIGHDGRAFQSEIALKIKVTRIEG